MLERLWPQGQRPAQERQPVRRLVRVRAWKPERQQERLWQPRVQQLTSQRELLIWRQEQQWKAQLPE